MQNTLTIASVPDAGGTFRWQMVQDCVEWFGAETPGVVAAPGPCAALTNEINGLAAGIVSLQKQLSQVSGRDRPEIHQEIEDAQGQVGALQKRKATLGCR